MSLTEKKGLYWSIASDGYWQLHVAATEEGLCYVGALHGTVEELTEWAAARMPDHELIPHSDKLSPYTEELVGYLSGARRDFSVPLSLTGTPFQLEVWEALRDIPYGGTCSYSDIAERIGRPAAVRAVGAAIGANPVLITVPCHRVIGKSGALTGYRGGLEMKTMLLEMEQRSMTASL